MTRMQHVSNSIDRIQQPGGGGRIHSSAYRQSLQQCEDFAGLEDDINRFELLHLVKRAGRAAGFTPRMIELLEYYMLHTQDQDWRKGDRPIVYQSVARIALALEVTERQIQHLEKRLFEVGALTWNASGNNKRYGSRDPETGSIVFAYGVDLTPLAYLQTELKIKLQEKMAYDRAWISTRREISYLRGQIRSLIREMVEEGRDQVLIQTLEHDYQQIAYQLRTHIPLPAMEELLERHISLHKRLLDLVEDRTTETTKTTQEATTTEEITSQCSLRSEENFALYKYNNPVINRYNGSPADSACQESVVDSSEPMPHTPVEDLQHVRLEQLVLIASDRFKAYLPMTRGAVNWNDIIEAAAQLRAEMFISHRSWAEACQTMGRTGAAICVLVTDRGRDRTENAVRNPPAYFREMIKRAGRGELRLHNTIFGLLEICDGGGDA